MREFMWGWGFLPYQDNLWVWEKWKRGKGKRVWILWYDFSHLFTKLQQTINIRDKLSQKGEGGGEGRKVRSLTLTLTLPNPLPFFPIPYPFDACYAGYDRLDKPRLFLYTITKPYLVLIFTSQWLTTLSISGYVPSITPSIISKPQYTSSVICII